MEKICPRCNSNFTCRNDQILLCDCVTVALNSDERNYLAMRYSDCLCVACLLVIKTLVAQQHPCNEI